MSLYCLSYSILGKLHYGRMYLRIRMNVFVRMVELI